MGSESSGQTTKDPRFVFAARTRADAACSTQRQSASTEYFKLGEVCKVVVLAAAFCGQTSQEFDFGTTHPGSHLPSSIFGVSLKSVNATQHVEDSGEPSH